MSNYEVGFWTGLTTLINAKWPEISGQIHRVSKINRDNWLNLVTGAALTPPYVVIDVLARKDADWGLQNICYSYYLELYYIASTSGTTNIVADVGAKLVLLRDELTKPAPIFTGFQVVELPQLDLSDVNPANRVFYDIEAGLFAGQITCNLLVGESAA